MKCSVIIPALNAEKHIGACIDALRAFSSNCEIIVSDGGSTDKTLEILRGKNVNVIFSAQGRGIQLNKGAQASTGDIFFFLHADTAVTREVFPAVQKEFQNEAVQVAKCSVSFDGDSRMLSFYARLAKIDSFWTSFGDQGIIVRRGFFEKMGGFSDWPLLEDVAFFQKARKLTKIHTLPVRLVTSAERFVRNGMVRQQLFNAKIILKYLWGVPPARLAREYEGFRSNR